MAIIAIQKPEAVGTISGNQFRYQVIIPAAAATINGGDLLVGPAANQANTVAVSASPAPATKTLLGFAGHAAKDGTTWFFDPTVTAAFPEGIFGGTFGGTFMGSTGLLRSLEGTGVHVALADPDNLYEVNLAGVFALTQLGALAGSTQDAGTKFWIADAAQANKIWTIIGFRGGPNLGVSGDTTVRVIVRFLNSVYVLGL